MDGLSFGTPWLLAALTALPALWWLLRVVPPSPRRQNFPAIALLAGLDSVSRAAARMPLWLLLLRLALAVCLVLAAAQPLLNATPVTSDKALLLVVDDGWAAGQSWGGMLRRAATLLDSAQRNGQPVRLLLTAPDTDGTPPRLQGPMPAAQAKGLLEAARPHPLSLIHI